METTNENQRPDPSGWLDSHGDYLYRYALARVGNKAVAEDLLQETLLAAIGNEICEILNVTPNNLCAMLHRGRTTLRNLLESEWFSHRAAAA